MYKLIYEMPSPIQFILQNVRLGMENGDTDFYMRHVPKPVVADELTRLVSDMVITSKWSEEYNPLLATLQVFNALELISYYRCD